jgi:hypothetical protein
MSKIKMSAAILLAMLCYSDAYGHVNRKIEGTITVAGYVVRVDLMIATEHSTSLSPCGRAYLCPACGPFRSHCDAWSAQERLRIYNDEGGCDLRCYAEIQNGHDASSE